jgi:uncharacterized protein (TIGR02246 family)
VTDALRLLAHQEIQQLAHRYAVALDARDLDALVALFVPDVRVGREKTGRAALRADFDRSLRSVGITFLNVGTHAIDLVDDDRATGIVYTKAEIQDGGPDSERWIHQAIQYHDSYERRDGRWLFVRRRHLLVYGAEPGESPLGLPPANWPASQTGIGSVPGELETWKRFWEPAD